MLKSLNFRVAICVGKCGRRSEISDSDDDVLDSEVLLCRIEHVMLRCNLWMEFWLVNVALGYIEHIFYSPSTQLPQLP